MGRNGRYWRGNRRVPQGFDLPQQRRYVAALGGVFQGHGERSQRGIGADVRLVLQRGGEGLQLIERDVGQLQRVQALPQGG